VKKALVTLSLILVFMFSCSPDKSKSSDSGSMQPSAGRPDTRAVEAASVVGYDGSAMRHTVDKTLNQNDARITEQQNAIEQTTGK